MVAVQLFCSDVEGFEDVFNFAQTTFREFYTYAAMHNLSETNIRIGW